MFKVTNKIGKINPILNGHKTVSYTNIKLPHFPNTLGSILNSFYFKNIFKISFGSEAFAAYSYNQIDKINLILNSPKLGPKNVFLHFFFIISDLGHKWTFMPS